MEILYEQDFLETHPVYKIVFSEYPDLDSRTLWAIMAYHHPDSTLRSATPTKRLQFIRSSFAPDFDPAEYEELSHLIPEIATSPITRLLLSWEKKLYERDAVLQQQEYTLENHKTLDAFMTASFPIWKQYLEIKKQFDKERSSTTLGGEEESFLDSM